MDVHPRNRLVYRTGDIDVVVAVEVGVDTTLQAHLGGACLGGLDRAISDVFEFKQIGVPRRLSDSGPSKPQKRHLNVHTLV